MSIVGNGTTGASSIDPASGYNLMLSHLLIVLLIVFFLFLYRLSANTSNPYAAIMLLIFTHSMICFMIFGIKICHKMPKNLTFQKLDCCDRLLVTSFAAALKPNAFDGSNYKWWRDRMILWLTAMNIIHVANGKPEQFTPEEEQAFMTVNNLFRGAVISVLEKT
jgi:peptidoglycan/LPS O-acetylase OafA/YrhL